MNRINLSAFLTLPAAWALALALINPSLHAVPQSLDEVVATDPDGASLGEAFAISRLAARPVDDAPGQWWVRNRNHGLNARFTPKGLSMQVTLPGEEKRSLFTRWCTTGIGYGNDIAALPDGVVTTVSGSESNRVEIRRAEAVEWYVNSSVGLEHGYTLPAPPAGERKGRPLRVEILIEGDLQAEVTGEGRQVVLRDDAGAEVLRYEKLKAWDATGRELTARMIGGSRALALEVEDAAAVYPLTIDPLFMQQAYLKASNAEASDGLGCSVAISGDTAIVGALGEDSQATGINGNGNSNSAFNAGAAYVFVRVGKTWTQQAYLKASNTGAADQFGDNDRFGVSVAISGDTAIVGATGEDSNATGINGNGRDNSFTFSGAAYVFVRSEGTWSHQAYLKASNTGANDLFGGSVAISGDTAIVGAAGEASSATGVNGDQSENSAGAAGAAYVFVRSGGTWAQQAYLKASNSDAQDLFGVSVAISGDTAIVGARQESSSATGVNGNGSDNSASFAGAAYVFVHSGGTWTQQAYLKASNSGEGDQFGWSVAINGDTAIVGARQESSNATGVNGNGSDNGAAYSGAAYVFVRGGGNWTPQAYLKASNTGALDFFGVSVAISGDTAIVGATGEDSSATGVMGSGSDNSANEAGAAYVFYRSGGTWTQSAYLKASNTGENDLFGGSVAISALTAIVGASGEDSNATGVNGSGSDNRANEAGAAYVFVTSPKVTLTNPSVFPTTAVGKTGRTQTIRITNSGGGTLTGLSVILGGDGANDFRAKQPILKTLAPGASTTFSVTFKPKATGNHIAYALVRSNAAAKSVTLKGRGK